MINSLVESEISLKGKPLPIVKVRGFLRAHELDILNGLMEIGELIGLGRERFERSDRTAWDNLATGSGLCADATALVVHGLKLRFGEDSAVTPVAAEIEISNNFVDNPKISCFIASRIFHYWVRFKADDGKDYFVDFTYGQVKRILPRMILDLVSNEPYYYGRIEYDFDASLGRQEFHQFIIRDDQSHAAQTYKRLFLMFAN